MSLMICPECKNSVSSSAPVCPHCGYHMELAAALHHPHPPASTVIIIEEDPKPFPYWIFVPLGLVLLMEIFFLIMVVKNKNDDHPAASSRNINVRINPSGAGSNISAAAIPSAVNPSAQQQQQQQQPPPPIAPTALPLPGSLTSAPAIQSGPVNYGAGNTASGSAAAATPQTIPANPSGGTIALPPSKGSVSMNATVKSGDGKPQSVSRVRFYLLDADIDTILAEAGIEDSTGQGLLNAFSLSVLQPERFPEVNRKAMSALKRHIVSAAASDGSGRVTMNDVAPKSYTLFAVAPSGNGFALWNSRVTVAAGPNALNLEAVSPTEILEPEEEEE